ncbi:MAG: creatininase family protein [Candidatus Latescibacteria bacterium]|nr:creatininase family protein [Candidatus Latescibacterota bacterium]
METRAAFPGLLEEMTMEEVRGFDPEVVVLPLGSTEPHGPHLPYGTDTWQVTRLARIAVEAANARGARVLLYPSLPITNNANFRELPFALRIGIRTLMTVIVDIVTQCRQDGIRKVVIVNGHGGNSETVPAALREISGMDDMPFVCLASPQPPPDFENPIVHPSSHGGESETSRMLWIRPDLVREDRLEDFPVSVPAFEGLKHASFVRPWHLYLPRSAGGETRESSAEKGKAVTEANAEALAEFLVELSSAEIDDWFPYKRP